MKLTESTTEFEFNGAPMKVDVRHDYERSRKARSAIAYVWTNDCDVPMPSVEDFPYLAYLAFPTTHTRRGDFAEVDRAWDMHNRSIVRAKREVLDAALRALRIYSADGLEIKFSRKAGCGCGCSPGFKIKGLPSSIAIYVEAKAAK